MYNEIIYSDEHEARIVRVRDVVPTIEERLRLSVTEIRPVKRREDVDSGFNAIRFPDKKPIALWWFAVTFESPEGKRAAMVLVALEDNGLRVVSFEHPELLFYSEALRARAREETSALGREYISALEEALVMAHQLWKHVNSE